MFACVLRINSVVHCLLRTSNGDRPQDDSGTANLVDAGSNAGRVRMSSGGWRGPDPRVAPRSFAPFDRERAAFRRHGSPGAPNGRPASGAHLCCRPPPDRAGSGDRGPRPRALRTLGFRRQAGTDGDDSLVNESASLHFSCRLPAASLSLRPISLFLHLNPPDPEIIPFHRLLRPIDGLMASTFPQSQR